MTDPGGPNTSGSTTLYKLFFPLFSPDHNVRDLLSFPSAQRDNEMRQIERRAQDQVDLERRRVKETEEQLAAVRQQLDRAAEGLEAAAR